MQGKIVSGSILHCLIKDNCNVKRSNSYPFQRPPLVKLTDYSEEIMVSDYCVKATWKHSQLFFSNSAFFSACQFAK